MDTVNQGLQKADPVFQNVKQNVQSNTGLYIGIGGAILGVGAIIIGGITYYTNKDAFTSVVERPDTNKDAFTSVVKRPYNFHPPRPSNQVDLNRSPMLRNQGAYRHGAYAGKKTRRRKSKSRRTRKH